MFCYPPEQARTAREHPQCHMRARSPSTYLPCSPLPAEASHPSLADAISRIR
jgi:hypothetical protein